MTVAPIEAISHSAKRYATWRDALVDTGHIFAVFDENTQDSGNLSFGWMFQGERYFAKTAGFPDTTHIINAFENRCHWLRQAARLAQVCSHPLLPAFHGLLDEDNGLGPLLLYDWRPGELVRVDAEQRANPASSYQRFLHLPWSQRFMVIDGLLHLHAQLDALDYVIVDLYDGSLLYDFENQRLTLIDLDMYHLGPVINHLGRWWGSSRFMAPEEFEQGAMIDRRTGVFKLGCFLQIFLLGEDRQQLTRSEQQAYRDIDVLATRACQQTRELRVASPTELFEQWQAIQHP